MSGRPLCMMCGGDCLRMWDHFGEGEPPPPICPKTGMYCSGDFCEDNGCAKEAGFWDDDDEP